MVRVGVRGWRVLVWWVVCVALFAGAVGGAVLSPAGSAFAQGSAPVASGSVPGVELSVGGAAHSVAAGDFFTGTVTSYGAVSSDTAVVGVSVSDSAVTLTPAGAGSATVTVTATNSAGRAVQVFAVEVLPAGCVVALGVLAAGAVTTRAGSWKSEDGCGAANGAGAGGRYARYYAFTVTEALEARFELSSSRSNRLYLLEGTGTGGRVVASAGDAGATWVAGFWRALAPGAYTLETSTYRTAGEAAFDVSIDSMPLSPPAACVRPLGVLAAGNPVTEAGSWDRGDACRSLNATARRSSRHYAAYYTFTVTEALEARFGLAGALGKRLYLLEGAGAAGRVLASATSRNAAAAELRRTLAPGAYTLEATTHQTERETAYTLAAAATPTPPTRGDPPGDREIPARADAARIDASAAFGGTVDTYTAASSDTTVATVTTKGSVLTLHGVAAGTATVTVAAANTAGRATQTFTVTVNPVTVNPVTAPQPAGTLAAQTLTAGDSVTVDVAGAFTGAVDAYTVTSSNAAVVDVALADSTVTLTGTAAGTATATVTAANTAGSATQTLAVTVNLPPAPTLADPLAAQTLQATETRTIDVAAGFDGRIDTYTATSGNTDTLTATADGPHLTLTGVTAGSTTVTVTAINAAGRAARSLTVTVNALTAPQTAGTPIARPIAVGAEVPLRIADAFTGIVHTYGATSSDTAKLATSVDGSTVTLLGVAVGTATVTLTAANTASSATATFTVTVEAPEQLAIAVSAPSHCLGSEGALAPGGGRRGVGHIDVTYHIIGGAPPYTITSPDAPNTTHTEPTGTFTISCAQRGIYLATAGPETNVVEAGPRTLTLTATDNTGTTTTTNIEIEVAENAYTTEYNGGQMHEGKSYILGTPDQWALLTLPAGLTLQFTGLSEGQRAHFTEPITGAEIVLNWTTGQEIRRTTPTGNTNTRTANTRTTGTRLNQLITKTPAGLTYGAIAAEWRPYPDLPDNTQVAVHPNMLNGQPIRVCTASSETAVRENVEKSADTWNDKIKVKNPAFPRNVFEFVSNCSDDNIDVKVFVIIPDDLISDGSLCEQDVSACAEIITVGNNPPRITGSRVFVKHSSRLVRRTMIHELGHFLGLGDYFDVNDAKCDRAATTPEEREEYISVMATLDCRRSTVQKRDLKDLHAIYHPGARGGMYFSGDGAGGWRFYSGRPPVDMADTPNFVSSARRYLVFRRAAGSTEEWRYWGWFGRGMSWEWLEPGIGPGKSLFPSSSIDQIAGREFAVVGITGGDIEQTSSREIEEYATWQAQVGDTEWSLGTMALVYGPPSKPLNLRAKAGNESVVLSWSSVPGATDYYVHIYRPNAEDPFRSERVTADPSTCRMQTPITGLAARVTHGFRVEAERAGVSMRSELSEQVPARLISGRNPRAMGEGVPASGRSVGGSGSCTVPVEVDPIVEVSGVCPTDEHSWTLRAVGEGFKCDRPDPAPVTQGERVVSCPSVKPPYLVVDVSGVDKCRRLLGAAPTASLGEPECEDGFTSVNGGASCSRTDSQPATATVEYSCPPGYALLTIQGVSCHRSVPASASTEYSCPPGYDLETFFVMPGVAGRQCKKSVAASASTEYVCAVGYSLVTTVVPFGTPLRQCKKSVAATAKTTYECRSGYRLVTRLLGGAVTRYCRKSVAATAKYSCLSGYTRSGTSCYKYLYRSLTGATCTAGYTVIYNGLIFLCRKKLTTAAAVTHSCSSGRLSGSKCVLTATPTAKPTYSCSSGRLSGSKCVLTATPTAKPTYSCSSGRLSGSKCVLTATPTAKPTYSCSSGRLSGSKCVLTATPTSTVTYDCDDAPDGYTRSDAECVKETTKPPTRPTIYTCPAAYTRNQPADNPAGRPTCTKIDIIDATVTTTPAGCPAVLDGGPPYQLYEDNVAGTIKHTCQRTITIDAVTIKTYTCPTGYRHEKTINDQETKHTCRLNPPTTPNS